MKNDSNKNNEELKRCKRIIKTWFLKDVLDKKKEMKIAKDFLRLNIEAQQYNKEIGVLFVKKDDLEKRILVIDNKKNKLRKDKDNRRKYKIALDKCIERMKICEKESDKIVTKLQRIESKGFDITKINNLALNKILMLEILDLEKRISNLKMMLNEMSNYDPIGRYVDVKNQKANKLFIKLMEKQKEDERRVKGVCKGEEFNLKSDSLKK